MKIRVTLDADEQLHTAIIHAVDAGKWTEKEHKASEDAHDLCRRWFENGALVTLVVDTDAQTCEVEEVK